jgi:hypothetical protein
MISTHAQIAAAVVTLLEDGTWSLPFTTERAVKGLVYPETAKDLRSIVMERRSSGTWSGRRQEAETYLVDILFAQRPLDADGGSELTPARADAIGALIEEVRRAFAHRILAIAAGRAACVAWAVDQESPWIAQPIVEAGVLVQVLTLTFGLTVVTAP